jgi:hypothetical protein
MPLGLIANVIEAIANGPEGGPIASLTMAGIDPDDPSSIYKGDWFDFSERALQYWPESISDTIDVGWSFKDVGGASHSLAQWSSNGGRTISFDVRLTRLMMPKRTRSGLIENIRAGFEAPDNQIPKDNRPYNVDIQEQIRFLRGFCYPTYKDIEGVVSAFPPPIMILDIPNLGLNESGGDTIYCIMTGCDVTYNLLFRDGTPRNVTVSLTLKQIVQGHRGVKFKGFGADGAEYSMSANSEDLSPNAGRLTNKFSPTGVV